MCVCMCMTACVCERACIVCMYVCECACVCERVCTCVHMCVSVHVCACMCVTVCMCGCGCGCVCIHVSVHVCVRMRERACTCMCECVCVCVCVCMRVDVSDEHPGQSGVNCPSIHGVPGSVTGFHKRGAQCCHLCTQTWDILAFEGQMCGLSRPAVGSSLAQGAAGGQRCAGLPPLGAGGGLGRCSPWGSTPPAVSSGGSPALVT